MYQGVDMFYRMIIWWTLLSPFGIKYLEYLHIPSHNFFFNWIKIGIFKANSFFVIVITQLQSLLLPTF